jgi:hypothetical protein
LKQLRFFKIEEIRSGIEYVLLEQEFATNGEVISFPIGDEDLLSLCDEFARKNSKTNRFEFNEDLFYHRGFSRYDLMILSAMDKIFFERSREESKKINEHRRMIDRIIELSKIGDFMITREGDIFEIMRG